MLLGCYWTEQGRYTRHDELVQVLHVLQLREAVQEERGVVLVGQALLVQGLEVTGQIVDPLGVQELRTKSGKVDGQS